MRSRFIVGVTLGISVPLLAGCPADPKPISPDLYIGEPLPEDSPARPLLGTYKYVGGEPEREGVKKAIDVAVADMSGLLRGIARDRLTDANPIPEQLTLKGGGVYFSIVLDDYPYTGRLDGIAVKVKTTTGDVMNLVYGFSPTAGPAPAPAPAQPILEQTFSDDEKSRINRFELQGTRLIMHVRVRADLLPKEVIYDLSFERL